jgi:hypothetical protein
VDAEGKIQNIVRQIDGAKKKDIEAKLADIDLAALPPAETEAARRKAAAKERQRTQEERAAPFPATVSHVAAVVSLPAPSEGDRPADREEQPQSPFVKYGLPATFEEYRRLKDSGQLDRNEASAAEEKTPSASPYAAYGLPPTFEEYRRLRDGKQRQEEPPPALKAHSLHVAAVGSVPKPSAEERHDTAVAVYSRFHAKSESAGNREMLREAQRLDGAWKEIEGKMPDIPFGRHMGRVAAHMQRFFRWALQNPREYLERWQHRSDAVERRKPVDRRQETEREREAERQRTTRYSRSREQEEDLEL